MNTEQAFQRYEDIRERLPQAGPPIQSRYAADLGEISSHFDVFVFDAFGVLNVGETPIKGARARIDQLREDGKQVFVLTNAASFPPDRTYDKFRKLGFDFIADEIISSRDASMAVLPSYPDVSTWGAIAGEGDLITELQVPAVILSDNRALYDQVDGFLFLSSAEWTPERQSILVDSLKDRPRPVIIANPDLVAPRETGLSMEPGFFGHDLQDQINGLGFSVEYHGKPFPSVYEMVSGRLAPGFDPKRIAMMGDTLHTDVLGAVASGWTSVLVTDHGLFSGQDVHAYIERSSIHPHWIIPGI